MTRDQLLSKLCTYDSRNPYWDGEGRSQNCGCDNCFYGRHELAEAALAAMDTRDQDTEAVSARKAGRKEVVELLKTIVMDAKTNAEDVAWFGLEVEARARALAAMFVEEALVCAHFDDVHRSIIEIHPKA